MLEQSNTPILISAKELANILGVKTGSAYKIIRKANEQLSAAGKITIRGKANRAYVMRLLDASDI